MFKLNRNMMMSSSDIATSVLTKLPPEFAHCISTFFLNRMCPGSFAKPFNPKISIKIMGLEFSHPIGLAAGFDKNANFFPNVMGDDMFSFVEVGTITTKPQMGNPKPRVFRLQEDDALINRLGFNSLGCEKIIANMPNKLFGGQLGINIGRSKDGNNEDYLILLEKFSLKADYIVINISSPNTLGLRDIQKKNNLTPLMTGLIKKRDKLEKLEKKRIPIAVKLSPDMTEAETRDVVQIIASFGGDAFIASNTTLSRNEEKLHSKFRKQNGGLSGRPLLEKSNKLISNIRKEVGKEIPIIGVGGVFSGADAYEKIKLGASLVQIYTSFALGGLLTPKRILHELLEIMEKKGVKSIEELSGSSE